MELVHVGMFVYFSEELFVSDSSFTIWTYRCGMLSSYLISRRETGIYTDLTHPSVCLSVSNGSYHVSCGVYFVCMPLSSLIFPIYCEENDEL